MSDSRMNRREFVRVVASATAAAMAADLVARPASAAPQRKTGAPLVSPERGFISRTPASKWEEALITGNGTIGALVMSQALDETVILSHERLFVPIHEPLDPPNTAAHLTEIRALMKGGKYQDAADFVVNLSHQEGWGDKRWTDPFVPACDLRMKMPEAGAVRDYSRTLDFASGLATVQWTDDRGTFTRRAFVSRPSHAMFLELDGPAGKVGGEFWLEQHPEAYGVKDVSAAAEPGWLLFRSAFKLTAGGYGVGARVYVQGGQATVRGVRLTVDGADRVVIALRVLPVDDFARMSDGGLKAVEGEGRDFDRLLAKHAKEHGRLFSRARLDLGAGAERGQAAEDLVQRSHAGETPPALLEKVFDAGRYAILSSCGEWPPNLQGVWAGTWSPPWSGDYTQNGNVQAAIASLLSSNMPECLLSYFRYLESHLDQCRRNAKRLYNARGIYVPSRTSTHFLQNHFDQWWPMTFWTAGAAWAAHFFYDYYRYTGDRDFLRKRALPYMKETAAFFEDFLITGDDGRYLFSPSYSPENNPGNVQSQACVNATMDIALVRELLTNLVEAHRDLDEDAEGVRRWEAMLSKLPSYQINRDGAVKEWTWPGLDDNYAHRHCSHLYALWAGLPPEIAGNAPLKKAFQRAVELRIAERRKEPGGGVMAFGLVQLGLAAGSLGDRESVSFVLDRLARNYYFTNLATSHDPGSIFNTDASGGLPAVLIHALVQSWPGEITLLPAVPTQLPSGRLTGVLCRGQVTLKELVWKPGSVRATVESRKPQRVAFCTPGDVTDFAVTDGREEPAEGPPDRRIVSLPAGKPVTISVKTVAEAA